MCVVTFSDITTLRIMMAACSIHNMFCYSPGTVQFGRFKQQNVRLGLEFR